jgi:hypothetical protein
MSEERDTYTEEQNKPRRWRPTKRQVIWFSTFFVVLLAAAIALAFVLGIAEGNVIGYVPPIAVLVVFLVLFLILWGYRHEWTGFEKSSYLEPDDQKIQPRKTLWDWLQLLLVPLALAGIGIWFTWQQNQRQEATDAQRSQDAALQGYLDQMSQLMLERGLRTAEPNGEVRTLARARTLAVLNAGDAEHKRATLRFLHDACLIQVPSESDQSVTGCPPVEVESPPVISLQNADLSEARLHGIKVLKGTDLSYANLNGSDLSDANLIGTRFHNAGFWRTDLTGAKLTGADLTGADLTRANLTDADVTQEQLDQAKSLKGATMPDGSKHD